MKNLAGHRAPDQECENELRAAGIEVVRLTTEQRGEVATRITGRIGGVVLARAWYYWTAEGRVPLAIAEQIYADPVGKRDVRAAGHCACPPPSEWTEDFDADDKPIVLDPDGSQEAEHDRCITRGKLPAAGKPRYVRELPPDARRFVTSYHIDSAEGLRLFADALRAAGTP